MAETRLKVDALEGWYGESHVLHGASFEVKRGEVVTLLGRNGAGKTSTMRALAGVMRKRRGSALFDGTELLSTPPHRVAQLGLGFVPEERGIFSSLTVHENLMLPPVVRPGGWTIAAIHELFPNLKGRDGTIGTRLSGGEQQMLAMARILRTGCDFILLDEPTEGLAPVIVEQIGEALVRLKEKGFTVLLVEQNLNFARGVADRHYVMEQGRIIDEIANASLSAQMDKLNRFLGI
ncbi:ABC transporter ATP-binding protein [Paracoccus sp. PS-1]|jgi:branched-chain amino acid transport system ATP-binding protein|uniref:ABC transporter ATP-binding protein n=1 Tax=Paracoccus TaxID=265 RepID=UPI001E51DDF8|nr:MULTISPECIES: ABC transporter ATP-binding protein [Paracoccus]MDF3907029.1 ABC transporter ATP-binding protein [Paracoccus sp. AS002]MDQ7263637.1 ABC transporter ATP-binding protein [Paracoccus sp. PS1]MDQ7776332.1 ABC transporter ATP-binding protein [Paracoccus aminovorans]UFS67346.1 ABC transporter ATP-binding protein [Paracoccus denitrificans]